MRIKIKLNLDDVVELLLWRKLKDRLDPRYRRAEIVLSALEGKEVKEIALKLNYSEQQVYYYLEQFAKGGIEAIRPKPMGPSPKKKLPQPPVKYRQARLDI